MTKNLVYNDFSPLCYFVREEAAAFCFLNTEQHQTQMYLHGLYAFILYDKPRQILALRALHNYGSQHSGIHLTMNALKTLSLKPQATSPLLPFFPREKELTKHLLLPIDEPINGGEILFLNERIVFWNFKSRSYSFDNPSCHDQSPQLTDAIKAAGLPSERFISMKQAQFFENHLLHSMLDPNGQYPSMQSAPKVVDKICHLLGIVNIDVLNVEADADTHYCPY